MSAKHPTGGKRLTQDNFAADSRVGDLVARHRLGASIHDPMATRQPIWGDFTGKSFQDYQDRLLDVKRTFDSLPATTRRNFSNDPYQIFRLMDQVRDGDPVAIRTAKKFDLLVEAPPPPSNLGDTVTVPKDWIDKVSTLKPDDEAQPHKKGGSN